MNRETSSKKQKSALDDECYKKFITESEGMGNFLSQLQNQLFLVKSGTEINSDFNTSYFEIAEIIIHYFSSISFFSRDVNESLIQFMFLHQHLFRFLYCSSGFDSDIFSSGFRKFHTMLLKIGTGLIPLESKYEYNSYFDHNYKNIFDKYVNKSATELVKEDGYIDNISRLIEDLEQDGFKKHKYLNELRATLEFSYIYVGTVVKIGSFLDRLNLMMTYKRVDRRNFSQKEMVKMIDISFRLLQILLTYFPSDFDTDSEESYIEINRLLEFVRVSFLASDTRDLISDWNDLYSKMHSYIKLFKSNNMIKLNSLKSKLESNYAFYPHLYKDFTVLVSFFDKFDRSNQDFDIAKINDAIESIYSQSAYCHSYSDIMQFKNDSINLTNTLFIQSFFNNIEHSLHFYVRETKQDSGPKQHCVILFNYYNMIKEYFTNDPSQKSSVNYLINIMSLLQILLKHNFPEDLYTKILSNHLPFSVVKLLFKHFDAHHKKNLHNDGLNMQNYILGIRNFIFTKFQAVQATRNIPDKSSLSMAFSSYQSNNIAIKLLNISSELYRICRYLKFVDDVCVLYKSDPNLNVDDSRVISDEILKDILDIVGLHQNILNNYHFYNALIDVFHINSPKEDIVKKCFNSIPLYICSDLFRETFLAISNLEYHALLNTDLMTSLSTIKRLFRSSELISLENIESLLGVCSSLSYNFPKIYQSMKALLDGLSLPLCIQRIFRHGNIDVNIPFEQVSKKFLDFNFIFLYSTVLKNLEKYCAIEESRIESINKFKELFKSINFDQFILPGMELSDKLHEVFNGEILIQTQFPLKFLVAKYDFIENSLKKLNNSAANQLFISIHNDLLVYSYVQDEFLLHSAFVNLTSIGELLNSQDSFHIVAAKGYLSQLGDIVEEFVLYHQLIRFSEYSDSVLDMNSQYQRFSKSVASIKSHIEGGLSGEEQSEINTILNNSLMANSEELLKSSIYCDFIRKLDSKQIKTIQKYVFSKVEDEIKSRNLQIDVLSYSISKESEHIKSISNQYNTQLQSLINQSTEKYNRLLEENRKNKVKISELQQDINQINNEYFKNDCLPFFKTGPILQSATNIHAYKNAASDEVELEFSEDQLKEALRTNIRLKSELDLISINPKSNALNSEEFKKILKSFDSMININNQGFLPSKSIDFSQLQQTIKQKEQQREALKAECDSLSLEILKNTNFRKSDDLYKKLSQYASHPRRYTTDHYLDFIAISDEFSLTVDNEIQILREQLKLEKLDKKT